MPAELCTLVWLAGAEHTNWSSVHPRRSPLRGGRLGVWDRGDALWRIASLPAAAFGVSVVVLSPLPGRHGSTRALVVSMTQWVSFVFCILARLFLPVT